VYRVNNTITTAIIIIQNNIIYRTDDRAKQGSEQVERCCRVGFNGTATRLYIFFFLILRCLISRIRISLVNVVQLRLWSIRNIIYDVLLYLCPNEPLISITGVRFTGLVYVLLFDCTDIMTISRTHIFLKHLYMVI